MSLFETHARQLDALAADDRLRVLRPRHGLDFVSNDYLALANSPELRAALFDGINRGLPAGSGGSRLLRGNHEEHEALEIDAARHYGSEAALFFATGFTANAAVFATLPQRGDLVVHDELIHASAHDGMKLGRAERVAVAHNNAAAFETAIRNWRARGGLGRPWIAVESLYSMDGDRAPLAALAEVAERNDAVLIIDEAHATGVFGPEGRGLSASLAQQENVIALHTCGKALGCEGALLCAPRILVDFLVNRARPFIFSTASSPFVAHMVRRAIEIVAAQPERRAALDALVQHAGTRLHERLGVAPTGSQIIPVIIGDNGRTMAIASELQSQGFDVRGIRPPTVPEGTARLRVSITLNVTAAQIDALVDAMEGAIARIPA
ncbi:8-amino-7-oxononanoate synthase [Sphingomonas sp. LaA6.9]|uniref:8-amino-7-oxononanoate synthase n=1 Tax=Sphingomonas sp. LaA6.9 TaxID=2919914 RepID=UPI001F4FCC57|nr:8-amino-7-oxononanoate synthase [Sphingomonas sp. LaA6.9]MCJ8157549.1 8-amino-7-oxononanoate synthase [Sphingomonas sp. LaA6.9]